MTMPALAHAAGLDCKAATTPTERAICADAKLHDLDAALARTSAQALRDAGDGRTALRQQQRDWLGTRDACGDDANCLENAYRQRIASLGRPDAGDMAALEELRAAVEAARRSDPEFPFEKAIKPLLVAKGTTSFSNTRDGGEEADGDAHFPRKQPQGVTNAEWRALQASHVEGGGENGNAAYTLMDLDGDGLRDLIVDTYVGGTGLFTEVRVLRQVDGKFVLPGVGVVDLNGTDREQPDASFLYAYGERGGNAEANWVRLHGRLYALLRESAYGLDNISLLRPWASHGHAPQLTIRYRYQLSAPVLQSTGDKPPMRLDPALHRALNAALARVNPSAIDNGSDPAPICPVPDDATEEERDNYLSYGPGHYTIEIVADVPVQLGAKCYLGQLRDWFGGYAPKSGLEANLCIRAPEETPEPDTEHCYAVDGKRTAIAVTAGTGTFDH